jgi:hypothetical protein
MAVLVFSSDMMCSFPAGASNDCNQNAFLTIRPMNCYDI